MAIKSSSGGVMPEGIGYTSGQVFQPTLSIPRSDQLSQQTQQLGASKAVSLAETVQRQADLSSNRAESLARQAEQLENRARTRTDAGVGSLIDVVA